MTPSTYDKIEIPAEGKAIRINGDFSLTVPDNPIVPFIEGDGIGIDVTPVMRRVVDVAVRKAYGGRRQIAWMEVYAGEKAQKLYGEEHNLPEETLDALRNFVVGIKGPLTTPVAAGMRSLNVAIRQRLDLYAIVRPIRYFPGTETPMKDSGATDMIIFREATEDVYTGIEWPANSDGAKKMIEFLTREMGVKSMPFTEDCGIGIKHVSRQGTERLVRKAIRSALENNSSSVKNPRNGHDLLIKDVIADNFLQQILLKPEDFHIIATLNLNGDYISDALAAQVGGLGIAPGGNIGDGVAVFEATHGSAPKYAGKNRVNPGSIILSAEMMLRHMGWREAADLILKGVAGAIAAKTLTYDLAKVRASAIKPLAAGHEHKSAHEVEQDVQRLLPGTKLVSCSGFGDAIIHHM